MISNMSLDLIKVLGDAWAKIHKTAEKGNKETKNTARDVKGLKGLENSWDGKKDGSRENAIAFARMVKSVK